MLNVFNMSQCFHCAIEKYYQDCHYQVALLIAKIIGNDGNEIDCSFSESFTKRNLSLNFSYFFKVKIPLFKSDFNIHIKNHFNMSYVVGWRNCRNTRADMLWGGGHR